jgi:hypothetical protein
MRSRSVATVLPACGLRAGSQDPSFSSRSIVEMVTDVEKGHAPSCRVLDRHGHANPPTDQQATVRPQSDPDTWFDPSPSEGQPKAWMLVCAAVRLGFGPRLRHRCKVAAGPDTEAVPAEVAGPESVRRNFIRPSGATELPNGESLDSSLFRARHNGRYVGRHAGGEVWPTRNSSAS